MEMFHKGKGALDKQAMWLNEFIKKVYLCLDGDMPSKK